MMGAFLVPSTCTYTSSFWKTIYKEVYKIWHWYVFVIACSKVTTSSRYV